MTTEEKPDHVIAAEQLASYPAPRGEVRLVGIATDTENGRNWQHRLWNVFYYGNAKGLTLGATLTYKTGMGHKKAPTANEVLACYCREGLDSETGFADWCANYGYDSDSISALNTYQACAANGKTALDVLAGNRKAFVELAELSSRL